MSHRQRLVGEERSLVVYGAKERTPDKRNRHFIAGGLGPSESHKLRALGAIPGPATGSAAW